MLLKSLKIVRESDPICPPFEFRGGKNVAPDRLLGARERCEKPLSPSLRGRPPVGAERDLAAAGLGSLLGRVVVRRGERGKGARGKKKDGIAPGRLWVGFECVAGRAA